MTNAITASQAAKCMVRMAEIALTDTDERVRSEATRYLLDRIADGGVTRITEDRRDERTCTDNQRR